MKVLLALTRWSGACGFREHTVLSGMKSGHAFDETPGKVVGRRRPPADSLAVSEAQRIENARAWKEALHILPIPKGVYRFRTHEEADAWLWQMLTRRR